MSGFYKDTWALVTGASSGIGEETARQLAGRGTHLILTARSMSKLDELAAALGNAHGIETRVVAGDLGQAGGALRLCHAIDALRIAVDHLVSNAGFGSVGPFAESKAEDQAEMVRVNCEAVTVLARHFLPGMVARRRGGILHVASVAGFLPMPYMATYAATKAYVVSLSCALAEEVRQHGVHVTALCPGPVRTGFQARAGSTVKPEDRPAELTAEATVRLGLEGYERGRDVVIPGALNKFNAMSGKLAPRKLVLKEVARRFKTAG